MNLLYKLCYREIGPTFQYSPRYPSFDWIWHWSKTKQYAMIAMAISQHQLKPVESIGKYLEVPSPPKLPDNYSRDIGTVATWGPRKLRCQTRIAQLIIFQALLLQVI